jgi:hypothetical protein
MLDRGYLRIARPRGVEVRIHWSVVAGAVLSARLRVEPLIWLGYLGVLVAHQAGHGVAVSSAGGTLLGLDSNAIGGSCRWRGTGSMLERAGVAWGGMLGQAVLLLVALALSAAGALRGHAGQQLGYCLIQVNLVLLALNLLPFSALDGALAWRLFGELKAAHGSLRQALLGWIWRWARRRRERRQETPGASESGRAAPASPAAARGAGISTPAPDAPLSGAGAGAQHSASYGPASSEDGSEVEEEPLDAPQPSEQAQREIDALLQRVQDKAARSRRGQ